MSLSEEMATTLLLSNVFTIVITLINLGFQIAHWLDCWCW